MNTPRSYDRYERQVLLKDFGFEGQNRLSCSSVLVIGAGGLGCPALQYLAAAGIGTIGIVDDDVISIHNLHRQILFHTTDIGHKKAEVAARRLNEMNDQVVINIYDQHLSNSNAFDILRNYDVVVDASDNFVTRYIVSDACRLLNKPLVYGAISRYEGQVAVFNVGSDSTNYRDLFPEPPSPGSVANCSEAGVLGVLPGMIGVMQAAEVIKLVAGIGQPLINRLYSYNASTNEGYVFDIEAREISHNVPKSVQEFEQFDYNWFCDRNLSMVEEIDTERFSAMLANPETLIVDVREEDETPHVTFEHTRMPLSLIKKSVPEVGKNIIVVFCQSGKRSVEAATLFNARYGDNVKVYSLKGGIINWISNGKKA